MDEIKSGYTRVSEILNIVPCSKKLDEQGRPIWEFPLQSIDKDVLNRKCLIGTNVHKAINAWYMRDFYPLNPEEIGYIDSFNAWKDIVNLHCIESEIRLYDESLKITGAIDMLGTVQGSKNIILIDFKTSSVADPKKWPLQAAFYHHLLTLNNFSVYENVIFLQLDKEGKMPKCHTYTIDKAMKTLMISTWNLYKYLTNK